MWATRSEQSILVDQTLAAAEEAGMVKLAGEALALKVQVQGIFMA